MILLVKLIKALVRARDRHIGIRIYRCTESPSLRPVLKEMFWELKPSGLRFSRTDIDTIADPFLFAYNDQLFCFFELKNPWGKGYLQTQTIAGEIKNLVTSCDVGTDGHLSFPCLFRPVHSDIPLLIPETFEKREVALFVPKIFPNIWEKRRILLRGDYVDSHMYCTENIYYLFTTEKCWNDWVGNFDYKLLLFYSDSLDGEFVPHPCNPIRWGRAYGRSGGAVLELEEGIFRISQDCSTSYGREIHLFKINKLTPTAYEEELVVENWFKTVLGYEHGGHHLTLCKWDNAWYWAVDLNYPDAYFQRFLRHLNS